MRPYNFTKYTDGTGQTFDIMTPQGELLASVPHWDDEETAEMKAKLIMDALNAYRPSLFEAAKAMVSTYDSTLEVDKKAVEDTTTLE